MKVDITHGELSSGLVFKKKFPTVTVAVQFSEEELQIIKQRKLKNYIVLERGIPPHLVKKEELKPGKYHENHFHLTLKDLMKKPDTYALRQISEAKDYEALLKEALAGIKAFIVDNESLESTSTSFEL